ncbi:MAG: GGDEF domain-containing protein, partial [Myxococcales bacterium]|nr:GGDEF domain-containing protein [Myxococcales bacterium]
MTRYTDEHRDPRIHARELPPPSPGEHDLARARPEAVDALLRGAWLPPVEATRASVAAALLEGAAALVPHDSAVVVERAAPHGWTPLARRPDAAESDASAEDLYEAVGRHARTLLVTPEGDDPVRDDGPAREVAVPIFDGLAVRFVARFHRGSAEGFDLTEARLLALLCAQARPWFKTSVAFEAVRRQSRSDPLTGLGNRRDLDEALHRLASAHRRGGRMLSLLMVDLDGFKEFNDRWGHGRGDEVLRRFARLLRATLRDGDVACRYGG